MTAIMLFAVIGCNVTDVKGSAAAAEPVATEQIVNGEQTEVSATEEPAVEPQQESGIRTVTDHNGNTVEVPAKIDRIVVADIFPLASVLAVFFDSAEKIVGMPQQVMAAAKNGLLSELYPEILNAETGFINGTEINMEELQKLKPDVLFYSADDEALGEQVRAAGIPALAISASNWGYNAIETLENWILLLSQMFPENDCTEKAKEYSAQVYESVQERVRNIPDAERKTLFFLFQYSDSSIVTSGGHFFGQWWADAVNAVNVGHEIEKDKGAPVNMEQIYAWNPEIIYITNYNTAQPEDIAGNTVGTYDWSGVDAVRNGKVYKMPLGMYRSYTCGVDTPVTLLWMAKTTYPELFADVDITDETIAYYDSVFGIRLTAEQAEKIYRPVSEASAY